jgi:hypothetical protein
MPGMPTRAFKISSASKIAGSSVPSIRPGRGGEFDLQMLQALQHIHEDFSQTLQTVGVGVLAVVVGGVVAIRCVVVVVAGSVVVS